MTMYQSKAVHINVVTETCIHLNYAKYSCWSCQLWFAAVKLAGLNIALSLACSDNVDLGWDLIQRKKAGTVHHDTRCHDGL